MSSPQYHTLVVPLDFSDASLQAVDVALGIASAESTIHVIHVLPEIQTLDPGVVWQKIDNDNRAHQAIEAIWRRLSGQQYKQLKVVIEFGDPGHRIAEFAEQVQADLIVVPSHGRTGVRRLMIGSVAERIVRLAHCPVLVLRG